MRVGIIWTVFWLIVVKSHFIIVWTWRWWLKFLDDVLLGVLPGMGFVPAVPWRMGRKWL